MEVEAPDNIYLFKKPNDVILGTWFLDPCELFENIEYTRTDVIIEKACVKLKKLMYDNLMFQGRLHREEVIDNFVEDFKNRMKEE